MLALPKARPTRNDSHPPAVAAWRIRLDQLDELLRGHPVDWDNWERDRGADYEIYLSEARSAI